VTDAFLLGALHRARLVKDEDEIALIRCVPFLSHLSSVNPPCRKACEISSRAHETVMRVLGLGVRKGAPKFKKPQGALLMPSEWLIEKEAEAEALFVASCRREE
jgi:Xaa-Pro dipeptidase